MESLYRYNYFNVYIFFPTDQIDNAIFNTKALYKRKYTSFCKLI